MAGKNKQKRTIDATETDAPQDGASHSNLTKKPRSEWVRDTRQPQVIFADRVENQLRQMQRRFDALIKIGNARNAAPTPVQIETIKAYLDEQVQAAIAALESKLKDPSARGDFKLLTNPAVTPGFQAK